MKLILIIEDDNDIRESMKDLLEYEGYEVETAVNGKEALKALNSTKRLPDIILLDLMMPVMDGPTFREEQIKIPRLANIPVILMTADRQIESHKTIMDARATVKKPIDVDHLITLLKNL